MQNSRVWLKAKLDQAHKDGYVTGAFGLRIRTSYYGATLKNRVSSVALPETQAEARSAGNAISGQSYGILNTYAMTRFLRLVEDSPYRLDIRPCALIHDALYFMVRNDLAAP